MKKCQLNQKYFWKATWSTLKSHNKKTEELLFFSLFAQHWHPSLLRAEVEAKLTSEKEEEIKMVEAEILQLKADIYNLKVLPTLLET